MKSRTFKLQLIFTISEFFVPDQRYFFESYSYEQIKFAIIITRV